jgi:hypothetical protein
MKVIDAIADAIADSDDCQVLCRKPFGAVVRDLRSQFETRTTSASRMPRLALDSRTGETSLPGGRQYRGWSSIFRNSLHSSPCTSSADLLVQDRTSCVVATAAATSRFGVLVDLTADLTLTF